MLLLRFFAFLCAFSCICGVISESSPSTAAFSIDCQSCICRQESQCQPLGCHMDEGSLSCGYYQIKRDYYIDCGTPGLTPNGNLDVAWQACSRNLLCSKTCFANYISKYASLCTNVTDPCERMARIHNGGPQGCQAERTDVYWGLIQKCLNGTS